MDYSVSGNLKEKYQKIGQALLSIESNSGLYALIARRTPPELSEELAFISDEILESYLEDLLDIGISNQKLYIEENSKINIYLVICLLGALTAVFTGLKTAASGESLSKAIFIIFLLLTPFALIYSLIPKKPNRRLFFAKLLAMEIDRRNGGRGNRSKLSTSLANLLPNSAEQLSGAN